MKCLHCGKELAPSQFVCSCGYHNSMSYARQYPMAWYKILIYFMLFAIAAVNIVCAVTGLLGSVLGIDVLSFISADLVDNGSAFIFPLLAKEKYTESIFVMFSEGIFNKEFFMRIVDVVYALYSIAMGVFVIAIRFAFSKKKKIAPLLSAIGCVICAVVQSAYYFAAWAIMHNGLFWYDFQFFMLTSSLIAFIAWIAIGVVNFLYFYQRRATFEN